MKANIWHRDERTIYTLDESGHNRLWAIFYGGDVNLKEATQAAELARKAPQLLEGCKKALTCARLPDDVKEIIRQAIAGTLPL